MSCIVCDFIFYFLESIGSLKQFCAQVNYFLSVVRLRDQKQSVWLKPSPSFRGSYILRGDANLALLSCFLADVGESAPFAIQSLRQIVNNDATVVT